MRVLTISGSVRRDSYNTALLRAAAECRADVEFAGWQGLTEIPAYDEDLENLAAPVPVAALRHEIDRSDAVLIATPEYNGSIPGALKNALDWVSRPFATNVLRNKRVAVVGASTGLLGAVRAQAELRKVLTAIGADVLESGLSVFTAQEAFDAVGQVRDTELRRALCVIVDDLVRRSMNRAA
ncbi:MAG: NADPH-dependent FMN reductase [Verrucomicrobiota bacterium]